MSYNPAWTLYDVEKLKAALAHSYSVAGAGSTEWAKMNTYIQGMSNTEVYELCTKLNDDGWFLNRYNEVYPAPVNGTLGNAIRVSETYASGSKAAIEAAEVINSNTVPVAARTIDLNIPASAVETAGQVAFEPGSTVVKTGSKLETALGHAATALIGTGIGLQLGVWVDGLLYNANPEFWDSHNMSELNPQTWNESIIGQGLLQHANYPTAPVLMDKNGQLYADENMYAMVAQYLYKTGAYEPHSEVVDQGDLPNSDFYDPSHLPNHVSISPAPVIFGINNPSTAWTGSYGGNTEPVYVYWDGEQNLMSCSKGYYQFNANGTWHDAIRKTAKNGSPYYEFNLLSSLFYDRRNNTNAIPNIGVRSGNLIDLPYYICYGRTVTTGVEGFNPYDTTPVLNDQMDLSQIINAIKQQYPDLADKELKNSVLQPDGTIIDHYYLPISMPSGGTDTQPESKPEEKGVVDPKNKPQSKRVIDTQIPPNTPTQPTDEKGTGNTPTVTTPTGAADALYSIYNPTLAEVKSLGAWLWSSNFIDQILKMFSSPMEAIISLHKIYGPPHTNGTQNIKVGYLDSGVSSKVVDEQYITVDCGTVNVRESFGSVFDYNPFSEISLYLPFIGIVSLDIADVMRGAVKVIYHIDVITGAVLAEVHITRDSAGGVIYQYTGSCAEHFPLSAGSYVGVVAGMAGIAAGVAGSVASGGALAPALLGAGAGLGAAHTNIAKSGNFTANAGAMGIKKPYFIISRPQSAMAANFEHMSGLGANTYCTLASLTGFVRVKFIHLGNISGATKEDLDYIESMLKKGVII